MNGIEKLTERIAADTQQEATALRNQAQAQAQEILNQYSAAAEETYTATLSKGKADAAQRVERMEGVARLEAKKRHLATKQEVLDQAFQLARQKMLDLPEEEYVALLVKLTLHASVTGKETLIFSQTDRARYGKRVVVAANEALIAAGKTGALTLSEESRPFQGGLYVQDGKVETNCTFSALVRLQRQTMAKEIAELLFA